MEKLVEEESNFALVPAEDLTPHAIIDMGNPVNLWQSTPKKKKLTRQGPGNTRLTYITWSYAAERMNEAFGPGNWSKEILSENLIKGDREDEVVVKIRVITPFGHQEAYGGGKFYKNNPNGSYADACQIAVSKAFRRAVAPWGIGLDLYTKEDEDIREAAPGVLDAQAALKSCLGMVGINNQGAMAILRKKYGEKLKGFAEVLDFLTVGDRDEVSAIWEMIDTIREELK